MNPTRVLTVSGFGGIANLKTPNAQDSSGLNRRRMSIGYGGGAVNISVQGDGLDGACIECGRDSPEHEIKKIRGGPEDRAAYICTDCNEDNPIEELLG